MIPLEKLVLLDTCVIIDIIRNNGIGKRILSTYRLEERSERPLVSVVTVGEANALATLFGWGSTKAESLQDLFRNLVIVDINNANVLSAFGELKVFARKNGHALSDNDLWIAATAKATDSVLITTDKDFDPFHGVFITREWVDPEEKTTE